MGYQITRTLICQVPMIHFQVLGRPDTLERASEIARSEGVALRPTEVKPKLDKFLMRKLNENNLQHPDWMIKMDGQETGAFQYKMRIAQFNENVRAERPHVMYYGNTGNIEKRNQLNCHFSLTIICFNQDLCAFIEEYIDEFFIVTNFGTMQGKGFGSYITDGGHNYSQDMICQFLCKKAGTNICFYITDYTDGRKRIRDSQPARYRYCSKEEFMLDDIKKMYSVMKSGYNHTTSYNDDINYQRSYLFLYFMKEYKVNNRQVPVRNEKAHLKHENISPCACKSFNSDVHLEDATFLGVPKYVRALLGIGGQIDYIKGYNHQNPEYHGTAQNEPLRWHNNHTDRNEIIKERIKIAHVSTTPNETIERYPSPVFFKIINNTIYFVGMRVDDSGNDRFQTIFNQPFQFSFAGDSTTGFTLPSQEDQRSVTISTPITFDIRDFLCYYVDEYNEAYWDQKPYALNKEIRFKQLHQ